jgi:hypothetical protein
VEARPASRHPGARSCSDRDESHAGPTSRRGCGRRGCTGGGPDGKPGRILFPAQKRRQRSTGCAGRESRWLTWRSTRTTPGRSAPPSTPRWADASRPRTHRSSPQVRLRHQGANEVSSTTPRGAPRGTGVPAERRRAGPGKRRRDGHRRCRRQGPQCHRLSSRSSRRTGACTPWLERPSDTG